jgi:CDP-glycerol glycerophosphotransferase
VFLKEEVNILETIKKYNKIILYMPTFRLGKQSLQFAELGESLKDILQKENILWIQKAHSADSTSKELKSENNILSLSPNFETNILMPYITLLITDYSSVATDARYFNKPILFYIPDYEEYKNGENGLTDEAEELMSGPKFYNTESLRNQIVSLISNPNQAIPHNYTELRNKCWNPDFDISDVWEKISKLK